LLGLDNAQAGDKGKGGEPGFIGFQVLEKKPGFQSNLSSKLMK